MTLPSAITLSSTNSLQYEVVLTEVQFGTYDSTSNSLILLEASAPVEQTDYGPYLTEGYLINFSLENQEKRRVLPEKIGSVGSLIHDISFSAEGDQAIIVSYPESFFLDLRKEKVSPIPQNLQFIGWWGEKPLFWEYVQGEKIKLKTIDLKNGEEKEISFWLTTTPPSLYFIIGDELVGRLQGWEKKDQGTTWLSIDLNSGKRREIKGMPRISLSGIPYVTPPAAFKGPDELSLIIQEEETSQEEPRIWLWRLGQTPQFLFRQRLDSIYWLNSEEFLFSSYRLAQTEPRDDWMEIGYFNLKDPNGKPLIIGRIPGELGFVDLIAYDRNKSDLWCSGIFKEIIRIHLPLDLHLRQERAFSLPLWFWALTSIIGAFLIAATFLWATKWGKRRKPRQRKPYF